MDYILGSAAQNNRNRNGWEAVKKCEYRFLVQAKGFRPFESRKPLKRLNLNFFVRSVAPHRSSGTSGGRSGR